MKTNELRIGNWIKLSEEGIIRKVTGIDNSGINVYIPKDKKEKWIEIDQFSHIPLTEEMLLRCGFEYKDNAYIKYIYKKTEGIKIMGYDMNYYFSLNMFKTIKIKSVHQLQNMYFILTGEELEVKL